MSAAADPTIRRTIEAPHGVPVVIYHASPTVRFHCPQCYWLPIVRAVAAVAALAGETA